MLFAGTAVWMAILGFGFLRAFLGFDSFLGSFLSSADSVCSRQDGFGALLVSHAFDFTPSWLVALSSRLGVRRLRAAGQSHSR